MRAVGVGRGGDDGEGLRWLEGGCGLAGGGEGLDASVAEPAVVVGEVAGGFDGLEVLGVGEVEGAFVDAGGLEDVEVSGEQGEGDGAGDVDAGVLELAFDVDGDGDEAAGGGFGEVSGPLVDADGADDLLGLGDLVHLRDGHRGGEGCGAEDGRGGVRALMVLLNEIRRYLVGKVLLRVGWARADVGISASIRRMDGAPLLDVRDLSIAFGQHDGGEGDLVPDQCG